MTKQVVAESTLIQHRQQGLSIIAPLKQSVISLDVQTPQDYTDADGLLSHIRQAKKQWLELINPIIEPIKSGLDLLYGLRSDIVTPLEQMEDTVKKAMKDFKIAEAKQIREAEETKAREIARLEAEAKAKEQRETAAKTNAMRQKLADQRAVLEQQLAMTKATETPQAIKGTSSSVRKTKKWKCTDPVSFVKYLANHPQCAEMISLLDIDHVQMNAYFKLEKDKLPIGEWLPGIEVYEDIDIAGRK